MRTERMQAVDDGRLSIDTARAAALIGASSGALTVCEMGAWRSTIHGRRYAAAPFERGGERA